MKNGGRHFGYQITRVKVAATVMNMSFSLLLRRQFSHDRDAGRRLDFGQFLFDDFDLLFPFADGASMLHKVVGNRRGLLGISFHIQGRESSSSSPACSRCCAGSL